jgi:hypothetical protein
VTQCPRCTRSIAGEDHVFGRPLCRPCRREMREMASLELLIDEILAAVATYEKGPVFYGEDEGGARKAMAISAIKTAAKKAAFDLRIRYQS